MVVSVLMINIFNLGDKLCLKDESDISADDDRKFNH